MYPQIDLNQVEQKPSRVFLLYAYRVCVGVSVSVSRCRCRCTGVRLGVGVGVSVYLCIFAARSRQPTPTPSASEARGVLLIRFKKKEKKIVWMVLICPAQTKKQTGLLHQKPCTQIVQTDNKHYRIIAVSSYKSYK